MEAFEQMYKILFNGVTDAIELLKAAQVKAEELYIKGSDCKTIEFKNEKN